MPQRKSFKSCVTCLYVTKDTSLMSFSLFRQTDDVPVQVPESEGEGTGIALVPGNVTGTGEEVAHGLLTGGVQGKH